MKIDKLSASRGKVYMQCPKRYQFVYDGEEIIRSEADHLVFGTLVHASLERWFQEDADLIDLYNEEWRKSGLTDIKRFREGEAMLKNYILQTGDKASHKILALEHEFEFTINDAVITGVIDRVEEIGHDTLLIVDYKTSWVPLTQAQADDDLQLSIYHLAARRLYPQYKNIILQLHYLRSGEIVQSTRSPKDEEILEKFLDHLFHQIKNDVECVARPNMYCNWCECKNQCEAYKAILLEEPYLDIDDTASLEDLSRELEAVKRNLKIYKQRADEIEDKIGQIMRYGDMTSVKIGSKEYYFAQGTTTMYDPKEVHRILGDDFYRIVTVGKTKLEELVGDDDTLREQINRIRVSVKTEPTLRVRQARK